MEKYPINRTMHLVLVCLMFVLPGRVAFAQSIEKSAFVGAGVYEIIFNAQEDVIYVAAIGVRADSNASVYKLDATTLETLGKFDVSAAPAYGLGFNAKTQTLYTSNTRDNSVHAIDVKTGKVLATINHGLESSHTRELVVDEDRNLVYVSDVGNPSRIWVIDGSTNTFSRLIENTGTSTTGLALDAQANVIYVTNMGSNEIAVIDLATGDIVKTFEAGGERPTNLILDKAGNRLLVANQGTSDMTVLNATTGALLKRVETGAGALGINFDPARKRIYVANRGAGTVTVIDSETYKVLANLETGTHPNTVAIDPKTGNAYVTNKARSVRRDDPNPPQGPDPNGDTVTKIKL